MLSDLIQVTWYATNKKSSRLTTDTLFLLSFFFFFFVHCIVCACVCFSLNFIHVILKHQHNKRSVYIQVTLDALPLCLSVNILFFNFQFYLVSLFIPMQCFNFSSQLCLSYMHPAAIPGVACFPCLSQCTRQLIILHVGRGPRYLENIFAFQVLFPKYIFHVM